MIENLRNNFLLGETFDNQEDFYSYIKEVVYQTFKETDKAFFEEYKDLANKTGSAASILLIIGDYLICINLGDSRAVLSRKGKAVALSVDQKPSSSQESQRITKSGGNVINGRVAGNLGVSRAFGDFEFKVFV